LLRKPFTGEDVLELQGHGGILVMRLLLEAALSLGAEAAEPGEFSKRFSPTFFGQSHLQGYLRRVQRQYRLALKRLPMHKLSLYYASIK
jgi:hypothetical protein